MGRNTMLRLPLAVPLALAALAVGACDAHSRGGQGYGSGYAPASARAASQERNVEIDQRQVRQDRTVDRGIRQGDLNSREVRSLDAEQRRIDRMQRDAMADGYMSPREQREIEQAQERLNLMIRQARRD
jgi:hypothetical protein